MPNMIKYRNAFHCAYHVATTEGVRGLYRGFSASVLGLAESTLQFVTYEYLKKTTLEKKRKGLSDLEAAKIKLDTFDTLSVAAVAKLMAAVLTYPHEVVRTRLRQTPEDGVRKYKRLVQTTLLIYKEEGIAALYGGMTAHLMRVVPNAAILFFMYEFVISIAS
jgi:solute carrier family 25, member 33/36